MEWRVAEATVRAFLVFRANRGRRAQLVYLVLLYVLLVWLIFVVGVDAVCRVPEVASDLAEKLVALAVRVCLA